MHISWFTPEDEEYNKKLMLYKHFLTKDNEYDDWLDNLKNKHEIAVISLHNIPIMFITITNFAHLNTIFVNNLYICKKGLSAAAEHFQKMDEYVNVPLTELISNVGVDLLNQLFQKICDRHKNYIFYTALQNEDIGGLQFFKHLIVFRDQLMENKSWIQELHPQRIKEEWVTFTRIC